MKCSKSITKHRGEHENLQTNHPIIQTNYLSFMHFFSSEYSETILDPKS